MFSLVENAGPLPMGLQLEVVTKALRVDPGEEAGTMCPLGIALPSQHFRLEQLVTTPTRLVPVPMV